jgi:flagella basal body P-ring formation protein FlgA
VLLLLAGAVPAADTAPVPPAAAARVAAGIAADWRVPVESLHLAWGRLDDGASVAQDAPFRLVGRGADGWRVVVFEPESAGAVAVRVRAAVHETGTVAARPVPAGMRLAAEDLGVDVRLHWGPAAAAPGPRPEPGWEARRPLATGDVLAWPAVVAPPLIASGGTVRLIWSRGEVSVSLVGVALNSARRGETVRARVDGRTVRLAATAVEPGTAVLQSGDLP